MIPALQQHFDGGLQRDDLADALCKTVYFGRIQLECAKTVSEVKGVDDDALVIRESVGLDDIHAPCGEGSGHISEKHGPVPCDQCKFAQLSAQTKLQAHRGLVEFQCHQKVLAHLLR